MYMISGVSTKAKRQEKIRRLVAGREIATQEKLRALLRAAGFAVNQPTLSRDLAELGIQKRDGRYVESPPEPDVRRSDFASEVRAIVPCGPHLIVVRTAIGRAQPVALAIDAYDDPAIVATLAGDDTVFVATKSRRTQTVALRRLKQWFGEQHGR